MMAVKPARASDKKNEFGEAFAGIKAILQRHTKGMRTVADAPGKYALETATAAVRGKPVYFAGLQVRKNYVSFYFMPVYCNPEMRKALSPALKKRMQGKACFNFTAPDAALFKELEPLVKKGAEFFRTADWEKVLASGSCD
jgi:hypothetical protein